jgi:GNAT superfamily N-acetyltransferase
VLSVAQVTEVTDDVVAAIVGLLPQLSTSAPPPTAETIREIVSSPTTVLLVARDEDEHIVGTLTLAVFRIPSGVRAWIEDVIVDDRARGRGAGAAGARTVELTSRPAREAANRLYLRLGFETRATNVYRITLPEGVRT